MELTEALWHTWLIDEDSVHINLRSNGGTHRKVHLNDLERKRHAEEETWSPPAIPPVTT